MSTEANAHKDTLNLPATKFDMRANLTAKEPRLQARWREEDLYGAIRRARAGSPRRILHDGPPYANGDIHMGHLLNKVLKDIVARWWTMRGYDSPYVPGWDCHGLPIEHKVVKELGAKARTLSASEIRALCHAEAMKWVGVQRAQFERLGVSGDWDNPYLTLDRRYEAGIVDVLADLTEKGFVFRQLKPIHWDIHDRTALAEAELEYEEVTSPSIYVNFPVVSGLPGEWGGGDWNLMIWTTTPWTLPANVAIAAHPRLEYAGVVYREPGTGREVRTVMAASLVDRVLSARGVSEREIAGRIRGADLEGVTYRHVFLDRTGPVAMAEYVGEEDGTGLVHTAPGHGAEDYRTGQAYNLPTLCPVGPGGQFTDEAPEWLRGLVVFEANKPVVERLRETGALFHDAPYRHSYPHGWRSKKPVIFRATEQWFIRVDHDDLRRRTLEEIARVTWHPAWGQRRIEAMVSTRPDWCVSRQRAWGVPIPAFRRVADDSWHMTGASLRHVRDVFREHGADAWFSWPVEKLLPPDLRERHLAGDLFEKGEDILDVWFESGSSHRAVLSKEYGLEFPAAMYLEGSDQHRGWFQSSILTAVGSAGRAPFESVLTHGFVVDDKGRKMSKSLGNVISAVKSTEQHGADVLRLYVAGMDCSEDVRMSEQGIKDASEAYRKIRNTFRYMLGNLGDYADFDPATGPAPEEMDELDRWAMGRLNAVIREAGAAYDGHEFFKVCQRLHQFATTDLSSFYLDVIKDRLYAESAGGPERRSALAALARLHDALTRLLAPITPHTAEELWEMLPKGADRPRSVHLAEAPEPDPRFDDAARDARWERLLAIRSDVMRELERLRAAKTIGSSQAATVTLGSGDAETRSLLERQRERLETICIVSEVIVGGDRPEGAVSGIDEPRIWVSAARSEHPKCARCWNHRASVGSDPERPDVCGRCARVLRERAS